MFLKRVRGITCSASASAQAGYVRCATLTVRVLGNAFTPNRRNSEEDRTIKGLVFCDAVWLRSMIYGMGLVVRMNIKLE